MTLPASGIGGGGGRQRGKEMMSKDHLFQCLFLRLQKMRR